MTDKFCGRQVWWTASLFLAVAGSGQFEGRLKIAKEIALPTLTWQGRPDWKTDALFQNCFEIKFGCETLAKPAGQAKLWVGGKSLPPGIAIWFCPKTLANVLFWCIFPRNGPILLTMSINLWQFGRRRRSNRPRLVSEKDKGHCSKASNGDQPVAISYQRQQKAVSYFNLPGWYSGTAQRGKVVK